VGYKKKTPDEDPIKRAEYNKQQREYYAANKDKFIEYNKNNRRRFRARLGEDGWRQYKDQQNKIGRLKYQEDKLACYAHYGNMCACCGEANTEFLAFDHINGGGYQHRKSGVCKLSSWLVRNNFPEGFRVLCHNCNMSRGLYGYCPHERKEI
jgi:hypothetical protein